MATVQSMKGLWNNLGAIDWSRNSDGNGEVVAVSPPGGFNIGTAEVHHKMDQMGCEAVANVLLLVISASIKLVGQQLQQNPFPSFQFWWTRL